METNESGRRKYFERLPRLPAGRQLEVGRQTNFVAQKTVIISARPSYVLQLNADGLLNQRKILDDATSVVDQQTTITP